MSKLSHIQIAHGSGRELGQLLHSTVLPALSAKQAGPLEDAALLSLPGAQVAFTTDGFVVNPLEFPGGDIGKLAACGTINDLAMVGAAAQALSVSLVLEEGCPVDLLERCLRSLAHTCAAVGAQVVCGDTKVVERGKADGMFITTSGIGTLFTNHSISAANARPGDRIIVSGPIGQHGIAVLAARQTLGFASDVISDCAPLLWQVRALCEAGVEIHALRDATRGGCAAVLNEIAEASGVSCALIETDLPISDAVQSACSFLGFDPLNLANEGRFIAVVPTSQAHAAVAAIDSAEPAAGAKIVGEVVKRGRFPVTIETEIGGHRLVETPPGRLLPRIC